MSSTTGPFEFDPIKARGLGTRKQFGWLRKLVAVTLVLNLIDAVLTLVWLETGQAVEANPVMNALLQIGPVAFVLGKIALVSIGSIFLWRRRYHTLSVVGIFVAFLTYYFILLYHLDAMNIQLLKRLFG